MFGRVKMAPIRQISAAWRMRIILVFLDRKSIIEYERILTFDYLARCIVGFMYWHLAHTHTQDHSNCVESRCLCLIIGVMDWEKRNFFDFDECVSVPLRVPRSSETVICEREDACLIWICNYGQWLVNRQLRNRQRICRVTIYIYAKWSIYSLLVCERPAWLGARYRIKSIRIGKMMRMTVNG